MAARYRRASPARDRARPVVGARVVGWLANHATSPGWRRRRWTSDRRSAVTTSAASAWTGHQAPSETSSSSWPGAQPADPANSRTDPGRPPCSGPRWRSTGAQSPTIQVGVALLRRGGATQAEDRVPRDRTPEEQDPRAPRPAGPIRRDLVHGGIARTVQDDAERTVGPWASSSTTVRSKLGSAMSGVATRRRPRGSPEAPAVLHEDGHGRRLPPPSPGSADPPDRSDRCAR